jgi:hypothetical protein
VNPTTANENKMLPHANLENKGQRVPTGQVDAEGRVRVLRDGPVPLLDIRTFRRSPADVSADAFHPTAAAFTTELQYAEDLAEKILRAAAEARAEA